MNRFFALVFVLMGLLIGLTSCPPDPDPIIEDNSTDSISVNANSLQIGNFGTNLKVGETFRCDLSLSYSTSEDIDEKYLILYWDDVEVETVKEFPYTFRKVMDTVGEHTFGIKIVTVYADGRVEIPDDYNRTVTVHVTE